MRLNKDLNIYVSQMFLPRYLLLVGQTRASSLKDV